jgi:hypothetical protein
MKYGEGEEIDALTEDYSFTHAGSTKSISTALRAQSAYESQQNLARGCGERERERERGDKRIYFHY